MATLPQASMPFSETETDYISNLDPFKDAELLRTELPLIRECSVRVFILCTVFLNGQLLLDFLLLI
ncbi:putative 1-phosphatidylinositol 4-kinase [Helianthus annuus]|nr:putative 1-phosphatidylinositol 4-kinase [Helianthus annuus]